MKNLKKQLSENKELTKAIDKVGHLSVDDFIMNAKRYIKAIKDGRMICSIGSVSSSGMSRTIKFVEMDKGSDKQFRVYNFWALFKALGYSPVKQSDYFRISGCGMDMIFHTNYSIIHNLGRLGFLNNTEVATLAQKTPPII